MAAGSRTFHKAEEAVETLSDIEERDSLPRVIYLVIVLIPLKKSASYADIMIGVQTRNYPTGYGTSGLYLLNGVCQELNCKIVLHSTDFFTVYHHNR
jgi:hypothetical protein